MDDLDRRLIAELRVNGRASVPKLAALLQVAPGTVKARLDRLSDSGVIAGFTVRLRDDAAAGAIRGVMMIELSGRNIRGVIATLKKTIGFAALHTTNGVWDLVAEIEVASLAEFHRIVTSVRALEGIGKSETHLYLGPA